MATRDAVCRVLFHPEEPERCIIVLLEDESGLVRQAVALLDEP